MSFFFFTKLKNRKVEQVLSGGWVPVGGGGGRERVWEGEYVQLLCTYVCRWKNETCGNYSSNGGRRDKRE
jgi:hypothetical protein